MAPGPGGIPNRYSARGVGPAQRPSLRSWPGRLKGSGVLQVPEGNASGGGRPPYLPRAYSTGYYRSAPPLFPSVSFPQLKATFSQRSRSNNDIEGLPVPALSTSPDLCLAPSPETGSVRERTKLLEARAGASWPHFRLPGSGR